MAGTRVQIDLYYEGKTPQQVNAEFPQLFTAIRAMKAKSVKINAGLPNEEMTVKAVYHVCRHNEQPPKPCEPEQEI